MPSVLQPLARDFLTWVKPETYVVLGPQRLLEIIGDRKKSTSEINAESSRYELVRKESKLATTAEGRAPQTLTLRPRTRPGPPAPRRQPSEAARAVA